MKALLSLVFAFLVPTLAFTQNNLLDATFGKYGFSKTRFNQWSSEISKLALQKDGKIVAAGYYFQKGVVARYNLDGSPDTSFGKKGIVEIGDSSFYVTLTSTGIQTDNKIVVSGYCAKVGGDLDFLLARFNQNGELDSSFGLNGLVVTDFEKNSIDDSRCLKLQKNDKILVAGNSEGSFCVIRFNSNGTLDKGFGIDGKVRTKVGSLYDQTGDLTIQPDGKLLIAGMSKNNDSNSDFTILRYDETGVLDKTFGLNAIKTIDLFANDFAFSIVVLEDKKILVAGTSYASICILKLDENGDFDKTFGKSGIVLEDFGSFTLAYSMAIQKNGKLVVSGQILHFTSDADWDWVVKRFNKDGTIDTSFNIDFYFDQSIDRANSIIIQPDGKILVGGTASGDFCITRLTSDMDLANNPPMEIEKQVKLYPNPVQDNSLIELALQEQETISISVFDIMGNKVKTILERETIFPGNYQFPLDLAGLSKGVYNVLIFSSRGQLQIRVLK